MSQIRTTLQSINRQQNSPDGNPRYTIDAEGGNVYWTRIDGQINHVLNTDEYADMIGQPVILVTERAPDRGSVWVSDIRLQAPKEPEPIKLTQRQRGVATAIMTNGFELGIDYWVARVKGIKRDADLEVVEFTVSPEDWDVDGAWFTVTPEKVWHALVKASKAPEYEETRLQLMAQRILAAGSDPLEYEDAGDVYLHGNPDAGTDDAIIQIAIFDEIVYG